MKRKQRKIFIQNTRRVRKIIDNFKLADLNDDIQKDLSSNLSFALRITNYYGNLRIKYDTFNFTFIAFFVSILAIFISIMIDSILPLWHVVLPIFMGLILYSTNFLILFIKKYDTISFKHFDLQHYSSIMDIHDYPKIKYRHLIKFIHLIKKEKTQERANDSEKKIKNDLKTLILQYLYQANYIKGALRMRK
jgi:hypothetical protein